MADIKGERESNLGSFHEEIAVGTHSYAGRKALRRNVRVSLRRIGLGAPWKLCTINVSQVYLCYRRVRPILYIHRVYSVDFITVHGYIFHNHIRRRCP